jgi:triosephosphate isomerase
MSKPLKTYTLQLVTKGSYTGSVLAASVDDAVARARTIWCTEHPHPFEQFDEELEHVTAKTGEQP